MKSKHYRLIFLGFVICLTGCNSSSKYHDNQRLEQPPALNIIHENEGPALTDKKIKTGLNEAVILNGSTLILKQSFDNAWKILAEALTFNQIKINDRNRELGEYYVEYDPDNASQSGGFADNLSFFLFKDDYEKATYQLTLKKNKVGVGIRAQKMAQETIDLLDDGNDLHFEDKTDDGNDKLIKQLYSTLKNDLPLD